MYFVFRVDANNALGYGHLMRCLTLADALLTYQIRSLFICQQDDGLKSEHVTGRGHEIVLLPPTTKDDSDREVEDAQLCLEILIKYQPQWLVLDHYQLGQQWQQLISATIRQIHCQLLVIDDLCRKTQYANLVLDQSLGRQISDYVTHNDKTPQCDYLLGVDYALLKPDFHQLRAKAEDKRRSFTPNHLLISIGATDPLDLTTITLKSLNLIEPEWYPEVTVVLSSKAKNLAQVSELLHQNHSRKINLCCDSDQMAQLMLSADFGIGACGTTSWERACLGLPSISFVVASNQQYLGHALSQFHLCQVLPASTTSQALASQLLKSSQKALAKAMSQAGFDLVDGLGTTRVIAQMLKRLSAKVTLRTFRASDMAHIYSWQQAPQIRQYARTPTAPTWDEHQAWFQRMLTGQDHNYIIEWHARPAGMIRLTENSPDEWEVSILVAKDYHGLGIASHALKLLQQSHKVNMLAEIDPQNNPSINLFTRAGFVAISDRYYRYTGVK